MATSIGYDAKFLGKPLALPGINKRSLAPLKKGRGKEIKYTHFSIFVHKDRRLPAMSAVNIKGEDFVKVIRDGPEAWDYSDQIDPTYQIDNTFYSKDLDTFDRGHLVRRIDPCWGSLETSSQAEIETFRWVNCTPQHKKLNQRGGVWFQLEQHILEHGVKNKIADVSVFAGPILNEEDPVFIRPYKSTDVQIPMAFWKVIVWKKSDNKLYAVGFLMNQSEWIRKDVLKRKPAIAAAEKKTLADDYFEKLTFNDNKTYQVRINDIEQLTGIKFNWKNVTFPYKSRTPTAIKAKKLAATKDFAASMKVKVKVLTAGKNAKAEEKLLSPAVTRTELQNGFAGLLKRYEITNLKM